MLQQQNKTEKSHPIYGHLMEKVKQDRELQTNIIQVGLPSNYFINIEHQTKIKSCDFLVS